MQTTESPFNSQPWWGLFAGLVVAALLVVIVLKTWPASQYGAPAAASADLLRSTTVQIGQAMVSPDQFVLPFELVSVLLLAALVGAVVIAWPEKKQ